MAIGSILKKAKVKSKVADYSVVQTLKSIYGSSSTVEPFTEDNLYMRASGFGWMCPREEVLAYQHNIKRTKVIASTLDITFQIGHSLHAMLQDKLSDSLLGHWRCGVCGDVTGKELELLSKPEECKGCNSSNFIYEEITLYNDEMKMGGHPDGVLDLGDGSRALLEIKTINDGGFTALTFKGPNESYLSQINIYMWLLDLKKCYLVYINKNTSELKEFVIHYEEKYIDGLREKASLVMNGIKPDGVIPDRTVCDSKSSFRAKRCELVDICFANK